MYSAQMSDMSGNNWETMESFVNTTLVQFCEIMAMSGVCSVCVLLRKQFLPIADKCGVLTIERGGHRARVPLCQTCTYTQYTVQLDWAQALYNGQLDETMNHFRWLQLMKVLETYIFGEDESGSDEEELTSDTSDTD